MSINNSRNQYEPKEFQSSEVFKRYSQFCREVITSINEEITKIQNIKHNILTRNGTDNKITFTIFSPLQRNLITLYPNKTLKIEIRDKNNIPNPFIKKIYSLNDLEEVNNRVKFLVENL